MKYSFNVSSSFPIANLIMTMLIIPILVLVILLTTSHKVAALPEYSTRTGESCAACHVSAGGGGPRTLRGLLWGARGKPDKVPVLPGLLIAPGVTDGIELYQIACGGCHGSKGEGSSAMGLINTYVSQVTIKDFTLSGIPQLGMPAFKGQFTDDQLDTLVKYVTGLANGEIPPPPDSYPLPPSVFHCSQAPDSPFCLDGAVENGGN